MKRDGPKSATAIHGTSGLKFSPLDKANAIARCLENLFTLHDLYEGNCERRVEALLLSVGDNPLERVRPFDVQKINKLIEIEKDQWN
jgi:hypothetical protein